MRGSRTTTERKERDRIPEFTLTPQAESERRFFRNCICKGSRGSDESLFPPSGQAFKLLASSKERNAASLL